jgi:hypothetical protein
LAGPALCSAFAEDPNVQSSALAALLRRLVLIVPVLIVTGAASPALAADPKVEKDALALQKKAIEEDYLNVDYAAAVKNLKAAASKCGADKCKPAAKAAILRDLGAMQILAGSVDEGKLSFTQALAIDGTLDLDPAYKTPQLVGLWNDVKKGAVAPAPAPTAEAAPPPPPPPPQAAGGDFTHTPPTEALVRTPMAIYVEYPGSETLTHVVAKYKGFGMTEWKSVELKKLENGYGGLIPCSDVAQGPMQYYVQGISEKNEPVASSGSRTKPLTVTVKPQIAGAPTGLPGQPPPVQCEDKSSSECPPDFPGCKSGKKEPGAVCAKDIECQSASCADGKCSEKKESGESCGSETECKSGSCSDGKCVTKKGEGEDCESSDECESDRCHNGKCVPPVGAITLKRIWIGGGVEADWYFMPTAFNVCVVAGVMGSAPFSNSGYSCVDSSNNRFPNTSDPKNGPLVDKAIQPDYDRVVGGPAFGNIRIFASIDYALNANMLAGARLGYVFFTDPVTGSEGAPFAPLHLEARFTYLLGHEPLMNVGIAPMFFGALGAGEFDAFVPVKIHLIPDPLNGTPEGYTTVNAWQTAGPFFFSVGAGARWAFSPAAALTAAAKFQGAFGGTAGSLWGFAPEVAVQFGL